MRLVATLGVESRGDQLAWVNDVPPVPFRVGSEEGKDDGIPKLATFGVVGTRPVPFLPNFVSEKLTMPIPGWSPPETFISLESDPIRDNGLGLQADKGSSQAPAPPILDVVPGDKVLRGKDVIISPLS